MKMNYSSATPLSENAQFKKPIKYRSRAKSLIQQNKSFLFSDNKNAYKSKISVMDKIKGLFSINSDKPADNMNNAKIKTNKNFYEHEKDDRNLNAFHSIENSNIKWQPVYHETCKIKLPVNENNTKLSLPPDVVDGWVHDQKNLSTGLNIARIKNKQDEEQINSQGSCFNNKKLSHNSCADSNEEPYSKFKYHYNYYLVDEYLESLVKSQNKNLDATGLDEEGQLYENVSLNIKPIIMSKQRLENGVPYDPTKLLN